MAAIERMVARAVVAVGLCVLGYEWLTRRARARRVYVGCIRGPRDAFDVDAARAWPYRERGQA